MLRCHSFVQYRRDNETKSKPQLPITSHPGSPVQPSCQARRHACMFFRIRNRLHITRGSLKMHLVEHWDALLMLVTHKPYAHRVTIELVTSIFSLSITSKSTVLFLLRYSYTTNLQTGVQYSKRSLWHQISAIAECSKKSRSLLLTLNGLL